MGINELEPYDLSIDEVAILEFTNDGSNERRPRQCERLLTLTGKESYYWAVALAIAFEQYEHVDEETIYYGLGYALQDNGSTLKRFYSHLSFSVEALDGPTDRDIFKVMLLSFLNGMDCAQIQFEEVINRTQLAFDSLIEKQLIEDPLELAAGGLIVAALGFVPYGFTTKTRRGRVVYRKIDALYWQYDRRSVRGTQTTNFNFRLVKFLRAFKRAYVEMSQEEVDSREDDNS